jgi:phage FluMu gp28-like protein
MPLDGSPADLSRLLADEPLLLEYQQRYLDTVSRHAVTIVEKSRRIGFTWATAADAVLTAAAGKSAGGMDVYYLAYEKEMTREFIDVCAQWAAVFEHACEAVQEEIVRDGDKDILAFRIKFASGYDIVALSSSPRGLRGRQGKVIIDEAAFHDRLEEVLKAALALLIWGGKVIVISTHDGVENAFYRLVKDAETGRSPHGHVKVTFDDAIAAGLYRRICLVTGTDWSPDGEAAWRAGIIAQYGDGADEELHCIPREGGGSWISPDDIERATDADAGLPELYRGGPAYGGNDIARRRDRWVLTVLEQVGSQLILRDETVLQDEKFATHEAVVAGAMAGYRILRLAMDQTGMGEMPVERAKDAYGDRVEGVVMSGPRRLAVASAARAAFEAGIIRIPNDPALKSDLRKLRRVGGATGAPRLVTGRDASGHADRAWALFLAIAAAAEPVAEYDYRPVARRTDWGGSSPAVGGSLFGGRWFNDA